MKGGWPRLLASAVALLLAPTLALAQASDVEIKAAYLPKFVPFVEWPGATPDAAPFVICLVGADPFGELVFRAVAGTRIGQRPVIARRMSRISPGSGCHVAYLAGSKDQSVAAALQALSAAPVLTVTDQANGPAKGMIHFVVSQKRVRFQIDHASASARGLRVSSKLLSLALTVAR